MNKKDNSDLGNIIVWRGEMMLPKQTEAPENPEDGGGFEVVEVQFRSKGFMQKGAFHRKSDNKAGGSGA